MIFALIA